MSTPDQWESHSKIVIPHTIRIAPETQTFKKGFVEKLSRMFLKM